MNLINIGMELNYGFSLWAYASGDAIAPDNINAAAKLRCNKFI